MWGTQRCSRGLIAVAASTYGHMLSPSHAALSMSSKPPVCLTQPRSDRQVTWPPPLVVQWGRGHLVLCWSPKCPWREQLHYTSHAQAGKERQLISS